MAAKFFRGALKSGFNLLRLKNVDENRRFMGVMKDRSEYWLHRVGNREMVGFGMNGQPYYDDNPLFPFPSLRYKEPTADVLAILEKQKGDWKLLSIDDKKEIYRVNFCQTYSEFQAPTGAWMQVIGLVLIFCSTAIWMHIWMHLFVYPPLPDSFSPASKRAQLRRQIDLQMNPVEGLGSYWDYEKNDWKVKFWNTPPNPFVKCSTDP